PSKRILVERRGETTVVANPTPRKQTGQFLLNPVSPSGPIFHHQRSPTPGHTMANGTSSSNIPPQPIQDADPSNPLSCRNVAGFSKGGDSGEQAQHLELPQEAMVVERMQTPLPDFHVDSIKGYWLNSAVDWCKYYADDSRAVGTGKSGIEMSC
ncbi:hypothetical protein M378DRAFT_173207, partial [Amanita muscaria Koide BX008]